MVAKSIVFFLFFFVSYIQIQLIIKTAYLLEVFKTSLKEFQVQDCYQSQIYKALEPLVLCYFHI